MNNNLIDNVWSLANEFVNAAKLVTIDFRKVDDITKSIVEWRKTRKPWTPWFPTCINESDPNATAKLFLYELIANSVNYCYWYGRYNVRPGGADAAKMYNLLDECFDELEEMKKTASFHPHHELEIVIGSFITKLSRERFPLIDHRVMHLKEILGKPDLLSVIELSSKKKEDCSIDEWLEYIVTSFPGYSKDLFLKRAFLFIMQMHRRAGIFGKEIDKVLVPADYQVPKMLRWLGCIEYHPFLANIVDNNLLLAEGSRLECEIRAATIVACKRLAELAECNCEEVDTYLWSKRKLCDVPFHLVVTSNY